MNRYFKKYLKIFISFVIVLGLILSITSFPEKTLAAEKSVQKIANLIICVRFNEDDNDVFNKEAKYNNWTILKQTYNNNKTNDAQYDSSFKKYIHDISEGKIDVVNIFPQEYTDDNGNLKCDVWTLKYSRSHYTSTDAIVQEVAETLKNKTINLSSYGIDRLDNLSGNCLDNLTVIVQGKSDTKGGVLYPQKVGYGLPSSTNVKYTGSSSGAVQISTYNIFPSDYLISSDANSSLSSGQQGVIAHEFLHILGFGDLYRGSGSGMPVGYWDIMANSSFLPQYPLSYNRYLAGWIDMETIDASNGNRSYTLTAVSAEVGDSGGQVVAIKTPISDTELIVLEYREDKGTYYSGTTDTEHQYAFEHSLPSSGLIMYRVNTASEYLTNYSGTNDIYVYRPNVTDPDKSEDMTGNYNSVWYAALTGEYGKTSYGNTDLNADYSDNTLYYSDGTNSGIQISNVSIDATNHQVTFDISFADYASADYWSLMGESTQSISGLDPAIYGDESTGNLYLAYSVQNGNTKSIQVRMYDKASNSYKPIGNAISNATLPSLAVSSGVLYLACYKTDTKSVTCYSYNGSSWDSVSSCSTAEPQSVKLFTDKNALYTSYYVSAKTKQLTVYDVKNKNTIATKTAEELANPDVCKVGNTFYLLYDEWKNNNPTQTKIDAFNTDDGSSAAWKTVHTFSYTGSNDHTIKAVDGKLYALFGGAYQTSPVLSIYDGVQWRDYVLSNVKSCINLNLNVIGQEAYITLFNATSDQTCRMFRMNGGNFEEIYANIGTGSSYADVTNIDNHVYVAINNNGSILVKNKKLKLPGYTLTLTPPYGYEDTSIYVDGVPFTAKKNADGSFSAELHHSQGTIATMYSYKSNGAPNGMYVWSLSFANGAYTATAIPEFQDMIVYHGFSIRITGDTGIRMSSSIDPTFRSQLISSGVSGYHLVEYGTKTMTQKYVEQGIPFVILGEMTRPTGGKSYYTENGTVVDSYSVDSATGRYKFASVLSPVPESSYKTSYAFRAYIILEKDGEQYVIYGPIKSRDMYTVARQIMNAKEFRKGTNAYNFVQNIIDVGNAEQ
jgi:M6 family metalloprotease-like protein